MNRDWGFVRSLALLHNGIAFQPENSSSTTPLIGDVHAYDRTIEVGLKKRGVLFHLERDHELFDSNRPRIIPTLQPGYLAYRISLASSRYNGALPGSFLSQYQEKFHPNPPLIVYLKKQWKCQNGVSISGGICLRFGVQMTTNLSTFERWVTFLSATLAYYRFDNNFDPSVVEPNLQS